MIIQSNKVWVAGRFIKAQIEFIDGKISNVFPYNEKPVDVDYEDNRILPGFIDVHCHGAYGFDVNYALHDGLVNWLEKLPSEGVTSFCPTTITQGEDVLIKALENIVVVKEENHKGAQIVGIHFEGPYLDEVYKGAQPLEHIRKPSIEQFKKFQKASNNLIRIITLATERDENFELTKYCSENNINVSIGHSASTFEQAFLAIANGARSMTHVYNGMSGFTHRANGLVGAAFRSDGVFAEIIADGNHSTIDAVATLYKAKGKDHVVMITDSLMCKGSPVGSKFMFGGHEIEIYPDGSAHLIEGNKSLAGSTLKVNNGLRILIEEANVPIESAINSCTINPATLLKINDHKGKLYTGYDADITILDDDYNVIQTYCLGNKML